MRVSSYSFGEIVVGGESYDHDVIIHPLGVRSPWWRQEGHRLQLADLDGVFEAEPDTLVVGTGYYGRMTVPRELVDYVKAKGVDLHIAPSTEAVELFNELDSDPQKRVVAALHLTC